MICAFQAQCYFRLNQVSRILKSQGKKKIGLRKLSVCYGHVWELCLSRWIASFFLISVLQADLLNDYRGFTYGWRSMQPAFCVSEQKWHPVQQAVVKFFYAKLSRSAICRKRKSVSLCLIGWSIHLMSQREAFLSTSLMLVQKHCSHLMNFLILFLPEFLQVRLTLARADSSFLQHLLL